ncbi:uncharacterized membrane protein YgdD (TMEM256/DUF423 family) [Mucilaginibacter oryzae]|uniref:Uncharacterized membrane protein YgdD (TMEM256/DUF423 family) n=1 Tax=Mucilaginibacter oryzae TaxID=468058 RepID=A0A316HBI6_9SPHI|nr:DUF423 domain-containing protein [Mucilaginibacter oryzae]PWK77330.1 uncharacterized membrane protein YgdD (TMEM256/DUF423 family) [Mucilaginibacter oryzae]
MNKQIVITASFFGMLAVITGAFGAHGLKSTLTAAQLEVWHTAVQYNFYHVFALLFLSAFAGKNDGGLISAAHYLFTFGIILFSGSLYLLSCRDLLGWSWLHIMGPITPVGGLLFILGWLMLALAAIRTK